MKGPAEWLGDEVSVHLMASLLGRKSRGLLGTAGMEGRFRWEGVRSGVKVKEQN